MPRRQAPPWASGRRLVEQGRGSLLTADGARGCLWPPTPLLSSKACLWPRALAGGTQKRGSHDQRDLGISELSKARHSYLLQDLSENLHGHFWVVHLSRKGICKEGWPKLDFSWSVFITGRLYKASFKTLGCSQPNPHPGPHRLSFWPQSEHFCG